MLKRVTVQTVQFILDCLPMSLYKYCKRMGISESLLCRNCASHSIPAIRYHMIHFGLGSPKRNKLNSKHLIHSTVKVDNLNTKMVIFIYTRDRAFTNVIKAGRE